MKDTTKARGLAALLTKEYEGKWVALSEDKSRVLDASDDLVALSDKNGENAVYMRVPRSDVVYAF